MSPERMALLRDHVARMPLDRWRFLVAEGNRAALEDARAKLAEKTKRVLAANSAEGEAKSTTDPHFESKVADWLTRVASSLEAE